MLGSIQPVSADFLRQLHGITPFTSHLLDPGNLEVTRIPTMWQNKNKNPVHKKTKHRPLILSRRNNIQEASGLESVAGLFLGEDHFGWVTQPLWTMTPLSEVMIKALSRLAWMRGVRSNEATQWCQLNRAKKAHVLSKSTEAPGGHQQVWGSPVRAWKVLFWGSPGLPSQVLGAWPFQCVSFFLTFLYPASLSRHRFSRSSKNTLLFPVAF